MPEPQVGAPRITDRRPDLYLQLLDHSDLTPRRTPPHPCACRMPVFCSRSPALLAHSALQVRPSVSPCRPSPTLRVYAGRSRPRPSPCPRQPAIGAIKASKSMQTDKYATRRGAFGAAPVARRAQHPRGSHRAVPRAFRPARRAEPHVTRAETAPPARAGHRGGRGGFRHRPRLCSPGRRARWRLRPIQSRNPKRTLECVEESQNIDSYRAPFRLDPWRRIELYFSCARGEAPRGKCKPAHK
jgi:hypothetical protein